MKNVEMKVEGNILTIKVDLTKTSARHHQVRPLLLHRQKEMSPLMGMKRLRSG